MEGEVLVGPVGIEPTTQLKSIRVRFEGSFDSELLALSHRQGLGWSALAEASAHIPVQAHSEGTATEHAGKLQVVLISY